MLLDVRILNKSENRQRFDVRSVGRTFDVALSVGGVRENNAKSTAPIIAHSEHLRNQDLHPSLLLGVIVPFDT